MSTHHLFAKCATLFAKCANLFAKCVNFRTPLTNDVLTRVSIYILFSCSHVRMFTCSHIRMFSCSHVRMFTCSHVLMFACYHVFMFAERVRMFACSQTIAGDVLMFACFQFIFSGSRNGFARSHAAVRPSEREPTPGQSPARDGQGTAARLSHHKLDPWRPHTHIGVRGH